MICLKKQISCFLNKFDLSCIALGIHFNCFEEFIIYYILGLIKIFLKTLMNKILFKLIFQGLQSNKKDHS